MCVCLFVELASSCEVLGTVCVCVCMCVCLFVELASSCEVLGTVCVCGYVCIHVCSDDIFV